MSPRQFTCVSERNMQTSHFGRFIDVSAMQAIFFCFFPSDASQWPKTHVLVVCVNSVIRDLYANGDKVRVWSCSTESFMNHQLL